jgi:unsaturated rhamnogalacturonyl hydrolase
MFTYAMIKGVNQGYLSEKYRNIAKKCYEGVLNTFIRVDNVGEVHLTSCCSVAGLGGKPYRDGSYEYYISEPVRDNDPKGLGPFILASLEFEKSKKSANN